LSRTVTLPPGPRELVPIATIRADPLGFLEGVTREHGDVVRHETESGPVVTLNRPELARHVLRNRERNYVKRGTPDDLMLTPLLGRGLLTSEGDVWKRQRRITQPSFDRARVESLGALIVEETERLIDRWGDGGLVRLDHDLSSLTLAVVSRAILGSDVSGMGRRFGEAVDTVNRFMGHYDPLLPGEEGAAARTAFANALKLLDGIVSLLVQGRRASGEESDDLLGALLAAGFDAREIRDQVLTMLMAGHETTAKALGWTIYLLDRHPEAADAPLLQLIKESMRLYPPVWLLSRTARVDDEVAGYRIPAGTLVCVSPYLLHRHPGYWADPERFDPSRFAVDPPDFAYLPFSDGPRRCIGERLAMFEAELVLRTLRERVRIELDPAHPVEPEALVTLRPKHGLVATVTRL
jgi:cytochrome P450